MQNKIVPIDGGATPLSVANNLPFMLIAGPCVMESRDHILKMAEALKKLTDEKGVGFVFKASFDKANRTSVGGARGLGIDNGLKLFEEVKKTFNVPVITDIHDKTSVRRLQKL